MLRKKNQRLSSEEILLIRNLTLEGKSLNYLSNLIGVDKTTIYYQVRKFKSRIKKEFNPTGLTDYQIGELIGAFAGDGSYTYLLNDKNDVRKGAQHRIRYHLSLKDDYLYALYLRDLLIKLNLNPHLYKRESNGTIDVAISSRLFIDLIREYLIWEGKKTYSVRLKNNLSSYSDDFLKGFVRGLMDTDGYVEISNPGITCVSQQLIRDLRSIFDKYKIDYKYSIRKHNDHRRNGHLVRVYRGSLDDYQKLFGFSNSYKSEKIRGILNRKS